MEGINEIPRDYYSGCPNIWLLKEVKVAFSHFDLWVDPARGDSFCKVWIGLLDLRFNEPSGYWADPLFIITKQKRGRKNLGFLDHSCFADNVL